MKRVAEVLDISIQTGGTKAVTYHGMLSTIEPRPTRAGCIFNLLTFRIRIGGGSTAGGFRIERRILTHRAVGTCGLELVLTGTINILMSVRACGTGRTDGVCRGSARFIFIHRVKGYRAYGTRLTAHVRNLVFECTRLTGMA